MWGGLYARHAFPNMAGIKPAPHFQCSNRNSELPQSRSRNSPALDFPVVCHHARPTVSTVTKLAEIQEAILQLDPRAQQRLRTWFDHAALDLEQDSPELEAELLKGLQGPHAPLVKAELEALAEKAVREYRARRSA